MKQKVNMIRKHFYITKDVNTKLKEVSEMSGESESTILRLGLDKGIEIISNKYKNIERKK